MQVDPTLTRADRLVGQVLGEVGALPDVFTELEINFFLLRRLLGVRTQVGTASCDGLFANIGQCLCSLAAYPVVHMHFDCQLGVHCMMVCNTKHRYSDLFFKRLLDHLKICP